MKVSVAFFIETEQEFYNSMEIQKTLNSQTNPKEKNKPGGITHIISRQHKNQDQNQ